MATRQNRRNRRKSKRGSGMFSQGLRSLGVSVGDSTSEATKQIIKILTSASLTEEQKSQIRSLLPARTEDNDTFYENLNRDLGNAGVNSLAVTDIIMLFPPKPQLPSVMRTI
jgi:hypothetical protein